MPTDVRLGTELAGYRLESVIGRSLMSVVYLAEHLRLGRKVALKVLAPELNEDPAFRDRFIRESQLAASLDHPHVIQIYDAGEADGLLYLAMRYVSGPDLARLIRSEGPLAPERTLSFLGQIGGALDAAHAAGLVHRDVKPGNILIERAPDPQGPEICYLADFGLTRQLSSLAGLTDPGTFVGTVDFAAPEIIEGRAIDGRVDVYSIGCVLYQCLTGSVPFPRESDIAVTHAHLEDPRPSVTTLRPEFPPSIDQVVATAMARRKDDRFSSCGALMEAARASLVPSGDGHPTPESKRTVKRGRGMMARSSLGVRRRGSRVWLLFLGLAVAAGTGLLIAFMLLRSTPSPPTSGAELWAMRIDLSSERFVENRLIETRGTYDVEPSVSPDGRWIAFSTSRGGNREIYLTNPRGSVVVDLTKNHDDSEPAWSPDETQIAFASDRGGRNSQIYVMRRDGSHVTRVTDDSATDLHPTWSPDGTTIAFASASIGADGRRAPSQIKLLDLASGRTTFITSQGSNFAPAWSPDGTQIAFVSRRDGNREIYLVSVEGDNPQQRLTRDRRSDYAPSWSGDGQWIVFVSKRKGTRISG